MLTVRMGGDGLVTAAQVTVTTLLSLFTLPIGLALARGRGERRSSAADRATDALVAAIQRV